MPTDVLMHVTFKVVRSNVLIEEVTMVKDTVTDDTGAVVSEGKPTELSRSDFIKFLNAQHVGNYIHHLRKIARTSPHVLRETSFVVAFKLPEFGSGWE